jgi:hypothetical protein
MAETMGELAGELQASLRAVRQAQNAIPDRSRQAVHIIRVALTFSGVDESEAMTRAAAAADAADDINALLSQVAARINAVRILTKQTSDAVLQSEIERERQRRKLAL